MSKVVKVTNGDYKIAVQSGGTITLDTGNILGNTVITGNLEVKGVTTTVESTNVTISDNILLLNEGNVADGIPAVLNGEAGIEINRGQRDNVKFVFDENISWSVGGISGTGTFTFKLQDGSALPIKTPGIVAGGNLYVSTGAGIITVTGTTDYEEKIFTYSGGTITGNIVDDDNIPNTKAVADYVDFVIENTFQSRIDEGDTYVEALDEDETGVESTVEIGVDNIPVVNFYNNRTEFSEITIQDNFITTTSSNADLELRTNGTGTVKVHNTLEMTNSSSDPGAPAEGIKLYSKTQDTGKTGLYYINSSSTNEEIISKNRSLLFSMLF